MAEYTIPKPYRDFYVTNPYIELKESNERLQRIVKSGYVATDSFQSAGNQVITFNKEKHGFSLTNDYSLTGTWSSSIYNSSLWEQGTYFFSTGQPSSSSSRIRTKNKIPVYPSMTYSFSCVSSGSLSYQISLIEYDKNGNFIETTVATKTLPSTITLTNKTYYVNLIFRLVDASDITVDGVFSDITSLTFTMNALQDTSDVTVKVAENVAGIPTTADGWEQGFYSITTGLPSYTVQFIRTSSFIPVKSNVEYTLNASFSTNTYYVIVSHYDENKQHIETTALTSFPVKFKTSNKTKYIHISLYMDSYTEITPTSVISELTYMRMTSDPMIVTENDTRIVTMPPFTSLYIESNVPYHGHALDLAE